MSILRTTLEQRELQSLLFARLGAAGIVGDSLDALEAQLAARVADPERLQVAVVIQRFDPVGFVTGTLRFVSALSREQRASWHRELTRTLFLVGSPARLRERFAFDHCLESQEMAWIGPKPARSLLPLVRLLKPLRTAEARPFRTTLVRGARPTAPRELCLASAGLRLEETLIHLNHLLAEAIIEGQLQAHETLLLRQVATIESVARGATVRVGRAGSAENGLTAYASLERAHPISEQPESGDPARPA
jgi:hypothetical protein